MDELTLQLQDDSEEDTFLERLKDCFDTMVVYKDLNQNNFISSFKFISRDELSTFSFLERVLAE